MSEAKENVVVLVADDEPSTLALVAAHVRSHGYTVHEASDGDQAWQLAHEHLPDLVVLDVMMPGMSGWEVCRKIREAVSLAHTGVIMLTGIGENLNEMTSPLYGADSYLDKPFEFSVLDERIAEVLAKRKKTHAMGRPEETTAPERQNAGARGTVARASSRPPAPAVAKPLAPPKAEARAAKVAAKPAKVAAKPPKAAAKPSKAAAKPAKAAKKKAAKKKAAKKKAAKPPKKVAKKKAPARKKAAKPPKKVAKKKVAKKKVAKKKVAKKKVAKPPKKVAKKKAPARKKAATRAAARSVSAGKPVKGPPRALMGRPALKLPPAPAPRPKKTVPEAKAAVRAPEAGTS